MVGGASSAGASSGSAFVQTGSTGAGAGGRKGRPATGTSKGGGGSVTTLGGGRTRTGGPVVGGGACGVGEVCAPKTTSLGTSLKPTSSGRSGPPQPAVSMRPATSTGRACERF